MKYRNSEIKIDQYVGYLNEDKINLSPAFQRGHVWNLKGRESLLKNILLGRPIPAVFLYKEASGSRYSYNILDGKQRLESIILFIGNQRADLKIDHWGDYFFDAAHRKQANFPVRLDNKPSNFRGLDEDLVREFREYSIPTIEISLDDDSSLDEVINLFLDINQQGVAVKRFDIVKALNRNDRLLKSVFNLIAIEQMRKSDVFYVNKKNEFTRVLKRLKVVQAARGSREQTDRIWERFLEIAMFNRTKAHRKPAEILKSFLGSSRGKAAKKLDAGEVRELRQIFRVLDAVGRRLGMDAASIVTNQTDFYTLATTLCDSAFLKKYDLEEMVSRVCSVSAFLDGKKRPLNDIRAKVQKYQKLAEKQTTDASKRNERGSLLRLMIESAG